jgi:hypothetical protein
MLDEPMLKLERDGSAQAWEEGGDIRTSDAAPWDEEPKWTSEAG